MWHCVGWWRATETGPRLWWRPWHSCFRQRRVYWSWVHFSMEATLYHFAVLVGDIRAFNFSCNHDPTLSVPAWIKCLFDVPACAQNGFWFPRVPKEKVHLFYFRLCKVWFSFFPALNLGLSLTLKLILSATGDWAQMTLDKSLNFGI